MASIAPLAPSLNAGSSAAAAARHDLVPRQRQPELGTPQPAQLTAIAPAAGRSRAASEVPAAFVVTLSAAARQLSAAAQTPALPAQGSNAAAPGADLPGRVPLPAEAGDERGVSGAAPGGVVQPSSVAPASPGAAPVGTAAAATDEAQHEPLADAATSSAEAEPAQGATELAPAEQAALQALKQRDREVRQHEQAHLRAAGHLATGGASFSYQRGPDGRSYAIGGEVGISVSPGRTPQETMARADQIVAAALAPAEPSGQDRAVAARAMQMKQAAMLQVAQEVQEVRAAEAARPEPALSGTRPEGHSSAVAKDQAVESVASSTARPAPASSASSGAASQAVAAYDQMQQLGRLASEPAGVAQRRGSLVEITA